MITALDTEAGPNLIIAVWLPRLWAGNAVTMKAISLRFAENKQLKVEEIISLRAKLGQRIVKVNLLGVTSLVNDTILVTAYIDNSVEMINLMNGALKPTGSSFDAIEKNVGKAAYIVNNVETK